MRKLKNSKGFTLIEMLIVVAIIAILIAISIPMINRALESAREATDEANMRAALGIAISDVLMGTDDNGSNPGDGVLQGPKTTAQKAYYVITKDKQGYLLGTKADAVAACAGGKGYGKGTTLMGTDSVSHEGQIIEITVAANTGEVSGEWVAATS